MKRNFTLLIFVGFSTLLQAQVVQLESLDPRSSFSSSASAIRTNFFYEGTLGHPYLFGRWEVGEFVLNGETHKDAAMKYNINKDELIILNPYNNDSLVANREKLEKFIFYSQNNRKFEKFEMNHKSQFLEVLFEGKIRLLKRWKKNFIQADSHVTYNTGKHYDEYELKDALFVEKDGKVEKLSGKNDFIALFGNAESKIKHYIHTQDLNLKDENALIEVLKYYEGLE